MVTYEELFQFCIVIIGVLTLCVTTLRKMEVSLKKLKGGSNFKKLEYNICFGEKEMCKNKKKQQDVLLHAKSVNIGGPCMEQY